MKSLKIVVTGGAGFIGSHFIRYLLKTEPECEILNIDKLTYAGNLKNLSDISSDRRYHFVQEDICHQKTMENLVKGWDVLVNFAAETHVDRSLIDRESFLRTDVWGVFSLLEATRSSGIKKFLQISTDEVYGFIRKGSVSEDGLLSPTNPYAATKAAADLLALSYFRTCRIPVCIIRSTNNFGSFQHPEKMIPLFITNALEGKELPLYGDGHQVREWLFVEDNCRAIGIILKKGKPGHIYHVSPQVGYRNLTVARKIIRMLGKEESLIKKVKDRPGHDRRYSLACEKIKKLGWQPQWKFEKALAETVDWYRRNVSWWKSIKNGSFRHYYQQQYQGR